jgi:hypothetical protein
MFRIGNVLVRIRIHGSDLRITDADKALDPDPFFLSLFIKPWPRFTIFLNELINFYKMVHNNDMRQVSTIKNKPYQADKSRGYHTDVL